MNMVAFPGRLFNIKILGLRLKLFYYPKMCSYKYLVKFSGKVKHPKWWVLWFRFGWKYLSIQLEENNA